MKRFLFFFSFLLFSLTIILLSFKPILAMFSLIFFWLSSFLILLTDNSIFLLNILNSLVFLLYAFFQFRNPAVITVMLIILLLAFLLREKIYQIKTKKELKLKIFTRAYFDFNLFFKLILYFAIFSLILISFFQKEDFTKIFQVSFDTIDKIASSFQIGISSKITVTDILEMETRKLKLPIAIGPEIYQTAIEILNQQLFFKLKPTTTLREIIWQSINQSTIWKMIFLVFVSLLLLSISRFLILLISLPSIILAKILVSILIKLNWIYKSTQKVDKETLIIRNG